MLDEQQTSPELPHPRQKLSPRQKKRKLFIRDLAVLGVIFALGTGVGFLLWGNDPGTGNPSPLATVPKTEQQGGENTAALAGEINLPEKYVFPTQWGNVGPQLIDSGAIDFGKFEAIYQNANQPLTEAQRTILLEGSDEQIVIDRENAYFLLNYFWALGLVNQNPVLTEGPMMQYGAEQVGRFASTGGWTIGKKTSTALYASVPILLLTEDQQARLEEVAQAVYRPCCNNSTYFPDCNHGMAMLGLLTQLASQDVSEDEMFAAAKYANAFWFPQQTLEMAIFFKASKGLDFSEIDSRQAVQLESFSASGFQNVHQWLADNGLLEQAPGGGNSCGV
ncbi:MAG: hypothetical protein GXP40_04335 [Chloroflexi bacterium]|nr:hypothetical protein [Chloroflexota bacterium]